MSEFYWISWWSTSPDINYFCDAPSGIHLKDKLPENVIIHHVVSRLFTELVSPDQTKKYIYTLYTSRLNKHTVGQ